MSEPVEREESVEEVDEAFSEETKSMRLRKCMDSLDSMRKLAMASVVTAAIAAAGFVVETTNLEHYYLVDEYGTVSRLKKTDNVSLTETALYAFAENAIMSLFNINYKNYDDKLAYVSRFFYQKSFDDLKRELERSGFKKNLIRFHRDVSIVPTSSFFKFTRAGNGLYKVYRSFAMEIVGDDGTRVEEPVFVVTIAEVKRSPRYYAGLMVVSIKRMSLKEARKL